MVQRNILRAICQCWQGVWIFLQISVASWLLNADPGRRASTQVGPVLPGGKEVLPVWGLAWSVKWNSRELPWNRRKRTKKQTMYHSRFSSILLFEGLQQTLDRGSKYCCRFRTVRVLDSAAIARFKESHTRYSGLCETQPVILQQLFSNWRAPCDMNWASLKHSLWYCRLQIHAQLCGTVHSSVPPWVAAAAWAKLWALTAWRLGS